MGLYVVIVLVSLSLGLVLNWAGTERPAYFIKLDNASLWGSVIVEEIVGVEGISAEGIPSIFYHFMWWLALVIFLV